ncbi:uncharacterized protein EI90DRAFT_2418104 [Cantharellus anzutake]|uniref:uncharacterized protein n=1 Tax=Cantharellus anzutake TaxID=1750568 RepID=UPI001905E527|nr:uncharacterized protein EI90DRAFT_2418104 [Cantharellus anzutake]KAF8338829.1 hypothetical protein EI90DRAFT_2418104 [Cantharellus anzutake]
MELRLRVWRSNGSKGIGVAQIEKLSARWQEALGNVSSVTLSGDGVDSLQRNCQLPGTSLLGTNGPTLLARVREHQHNIGLLTHIYLHSITAAGSSDGIVFSAPTKTSCFNYGRNATLCGLARFLPFSLYGVKVTTVQSLWPLAIRLVLNCEPRT